MKAIGGVVFAVCVFGLAGAGWAQADPDPGGAQTMPLSGRSAISGTITGIQGNQVILRGQAGREATLQGQDTRGLKVGDRVRIVQGQVRKVGAMPEPIPRPGR